MSDHVHTTDHVSAGLAPYKAPRFPCAACGKETKEHTVLAVSKEGQEVEHGSLREAIILGSSNVTERRICSDSKCRAVHVTAPSSL